MLAVAALVAGLLAFGFGAFESDGEPAVVSGSPGFAPESAEPATPVTLLPPGELVEHLVDAPETSVLAEATAATVAVLPAPDADTVTHELGHPTPSGAPLVFLVEDVRGAWLRVQLPVRPNGTTGWIHQDGVALSTHRYRIVVDVTERTFRLFEGGEVVMASDVAVGARDTPTPGGTFYVKELLRPPDPNTVYGPYAFGLSGFSNALSEFAGGEGVIGIHGTDDPDAIGREVSHGCIRLPNDRIVELAGMLPLGTPVAIEG